MDKGNLPEELRALFAKIISTDIAQIRTAVDASYDEECTLQNPYMILNGREEIARSYIALANSNMELRCEIETITYDATSQTAMLDMIQFSSPKALGGLIPIKIHQILKLQLESSPFLGDDFLLIARHHEVHVAQDYIAQLPILGGFYETGIRSALGQLTLAGSAVLEYTGILDTIPKGVSMVKGAAGAARAKVGDIVGWTRSMGGAAAHASGVDRVIEASVSVGGRWAGEIRGVVGWAAEGARSTAAVLIEEGKGVRVECYSPTCKPGQVCYSPTCPRGRSLTMSLDSFQNVVKGMSGFKKAVTRATVQVMQSTGAMEKTVDKDYEEEEKRFKAFEAKIDKLHKEAKGYLDSVRAMTLAQKRMAETVDHFYDQGAALGYAGIQYKQAVESMDEDARTEMDSNYVVTVMDPLGKLIQVFPDFNDTIKRRQKKLLDYDQRRSAVKRLIEKPSDDPSKLPRAEAELSQAKDAYDEHNDALVSEIPKLIDLRVPYLDPSFEALVKIQLQFNERAFDKLDEIRKAFGNSGSLEGGAGLEGQVESVLQQIRELTICSNLNSIRAAVLLDSEGKRLIAKYYSPDYPTIKEQKVFEKALFEKTRKGNNEIILFDGHVVVYRNSVDTFLYLVGGADENEIMLSSCLQSFHDALSILLGQVEKRTLLENGDLVMLALDETIDDGIILESESSQIAARVTKKGNDESLPLTEQTIAQALKSAQEQIAKSLLK
ncbi:hypothetical protein HDU67_007928 [Dinochytrium kinnereticum]|nr:hypothetical protein HDU67_007928 [Dinochytrium kinnereticum]